MGIRIASTSVEPVEAVIVTDVDPTASDVNGLFQATGTAAPTTAAAGWTAGTWKTAVPAGSRYRTPAWFTVSGLSAGTYDWWIWVDSNPYDPVKKAGVIEIYD